MHSHSNPPSVEAHWNKVQGKQFIDCIYTSLVIMLCSWQFCEGDLEGIGRGLGEAIYRYHRMLTSKRLTRGHWDTVT